MPSISQRIQPVAFRLLFVLACLCRMGSLPAQLIFVQGEAAPIKPFVAPDATDRYMAKKNKLKATLRFGYLSYNKAAESLRRRTEFNAEGYPITVYDFSTDGKIEAKKEYTYDRSGTKIVAAIIEQYSAAGDLELLLHYRFDERGRLQDYREVNAQGHDRRMQYTYNAQGKLLRLQYIEPDGLPGGAEVYTYNAAGTEAAMDKTDIAGDLIERVTWKLDPKGRIIAENRYAGAGTPILLFSYAFTYDSKGRLIRKDKISRDLVPSGYESWTYDAFGHATEHKMQETGEEKPMREVSKYDGSGRMTQAITYNGDGSIFQWYKYSYDSLGTGAGFQRLLPDGKTDLRKTAIYNKERQIVSLEEVYTDGSGDNRILFRYSDDGLPLEEKHETFGKEEAVYWFVHERY